MARWLSSGDRSTKCDVSTTARLHAEADAAAQSGAFQKALALAAEILRHAPQDHRARQKAGLCLAALGMPDDGAATLLLVARGLIRRGFPLAAIGACRDALGLAPDHPSVRPVLEGIHAAIAGREGPSAAPRVPPPIEAVEVLDAGPLRLDPDAPDLVEQARALSLADPDAASGLDAAEPHPVPFFSDLSLEAFLKLLPRTAHRKLPAQATLMRQGDLGRSLVLIVSGEVEVSRRDEAGQPQVLARLGSGHLLGEMSLLTQKPRKATVRTLRPTELLEIDRSSVEQVAAEQPSIVEDLVRFARRRMIANLIATSPVFRPLGSEQRVEVIRAFERRIAKAGEVVIAEGTPPTGLFLVLEGEVEVSTRDASGERMVLAYLREGEVVGEIALLEDGLTTASVTASERSVLLHLPKERFEALVRAHPELAAYLDRLSTDRLIEAEEATSEAPAVDADELVLL